MAELIAVQRKRIRRPNKNLPSLTIGQTDELDVQTSAYEHTDALDIIEELPKSVRRKPKQLWPIHKIYLLLSLTIGLIFSLALPVFQEQDGQYHFETSAALAGLPVNLSNIESIKSYHGLKEQARSHQVGGYFAQYYTQKVELLPLKEIPRIPNSAAFNGFNYDLIGHLIPAIGVRIGYHIYPSVGVMTLVARLLSVSLTSFAMYAIIKWVKRYKVLFAAVMLSPVVMASAASLTYDTLNLLLIALLAAYCINLLVAPTVSFKDELRTSGIFSLIAIFSLKTSNVPFLIIPFLILGHQKLQDYYQNSSDGERHQERIEKRILIGSGIALLVALVIWCYRNIDMSGAIYHLYETFFARRNIEIQDEITRVFSQTNSYANAMPVWMSILWVIVIAFALFSESPFFNARFIARATGGVIIFSVLAIYLKMMENFSSSTIFTKITGVQGRYFTPIVFLLPIVAGNKDRKLYVTPQSTIIHLMGAAVVLTNSVFLINTLSQMYTTVKI